MEEVAVRRRIDPRRNEAGFSLTEVVMSLFLVTVGLMSLAAVVSTIAQRQNVSQSLTTMTNLGNTTLEEIKDLPYDSVANFEDGYGMIPNFPDYKRRAIVTPDELDTLKVVEVLISSAGGMAVSMQTVVTR